MNPPANASTANSAARRRTTPRERCSPRAFAGTSAETSTCRLSRMASVTQMAAPIGMSRSHRWSGGRPGDVAQRTRTTGGQGADRAGEVGDGVVSAVDPAPLVAGWEASMACSTVVIGPDSLGSVDRVPVRRRQDQERDEAGDGEDRAGDSHDDQEQEIRSAPPEGLAPAPDGEGRDRHPDEHRGEDPPTAAASSPVAASEAR